MRNEFCEIRQREMPNPAAGQEKKKKKNECEANRLQSSFEEKDLEILVDRKLNMSW